MSEQYTQNPTPTVQVKEIGLPEQMSAGKVITVAGVAAGAAAGLISLLMGKEEEPKSKADTAKDYLRSALEQAQNKDLAANAKKRGKRAEKDLKKQAKKARGKAGDSAQAAKSEGAYLLDLIRAKSGEVEQKAEDFAEGTLMAKLREFADEARVIAEEGKMKTAGFAHDVSHKTQDDLLPQAKDKAAHGVEVAEDVLKKAKEDILPQAKDAAIHGVEAGKVVAEDLLKTAKKDVLPQAKQTANQFADEASAKLADANEIVGTKAHDATEAVKRGGRETRSLLMWVALAGILVFTVFLDEEQQRKLKEVAVEVFGETRDMYTDMKGDTNI